MKLILSILILLLSGVVFLPEIQAQPAFGGSHVYYISVSGNDNDNNDGSLQHPWRTLNKLNETQLQPGDIINLQGGNVFTGTLRLSHISGTQKLPVRIQSYGKGKAFIYAKDSAAVVIDSCSYLSIDNIGLSGSGRKEGNIKDGLVVANSQSVYVENIEISGFQKAGLLLQDSKNCAAKQVWAHDNGFAGIYVCGEYGDKLHCQHIKLTNCRAENNPGDPTNFSNHSGNGILAGFCTNILIDSCIAHNNGWDMPRIGNGPVGIWCFEADSVIIQHCISYENKTSKGGEDGGGYDFDGGTTNSIIQYCLSYRNQGSAFGIFQYDGASPWHNNVIRFCISEDDGNVSAAHANAYVWNSSHDSLQFKNFLFYNNTLLNQAGNAIAYASESEHSHFCFYNNIFVADHSLLRGDYSKDNFLGNDWWSSKYKFLVDSIADFKQWAILYDKEKINGALQGLNLQPVFRKAGNACSKAVAASSLFTYYQLSLTSPLTRAGIDLQQLFNICPGKVDFNQLPIKRKGIGACLR